MTKKNKSKSKDNKYLFNYTLKKIDDRIEFINSEVERKGLELASTDKKLSTRHKKMLDLYADFILESQDILSERSLDYSYFVTDKQWRKYKEYKVMFSTILPNDPDRPGVNAFDLLLETWPEENYVLKNTDLTDDLIIYYIDHIEFVDMESKKYFLRNCLGILDNPFCENDGELGFKIRHFLKNIIENCNDLQREILSLYTQEYSVTEISEQLNISRQTVHNNLNKLLS